MRRNRHYMKIPQTLAPWMPGGAAGDWQAVIWNDITNDGKELFIEYLEPNERGSRSALYADKFYVEIGYDRDRADTVFVTRIHPADLRLPRQAPQRLKVQMSTWPGGYPQDLDRVDKLFRTLPKEDEESTPSPSAAASPLLLSRLAAAPEGIRERLRPGTDVDESSEPRAFLIPLRQLRARYRLDRHLQVSPRHDLLLRTSTTPTELPREERDALLAAFGIGLLNEIALADEAALPSVLESLTSLPIPPTVRAQLWAATLEALSDGELRREFHVCAKALDFIASNDDPRSVAWRSATASTLRQVGQRADGVLREILAGSADDRTTFAALASWAHNLAFSETPHAADPVERAGREPERVMSTALGTPVATVADEWVMKLRLPDEQPLDRLRDALRQQAQALESNQLRLESVEALLAFDQQALTLASLASEWRGIVGDTDALRADLVECQSALSELQAVLGPDAERFIRQHYVLPAEVQQIARVLQHPLLPQAPDWLLAVGTETERPATPTTALDWSNLLVHNERRCCLQMFCDLATELNEPQSIKWLVAPEPGADAEAHLREWFERTRGFLLDLPAEMRGLLGAATDFQRASDEASHLSKLRSSVPDSIWPEMERDLRDADQSHRAALVNAYLRAVTFFNDELDGCDTLPFATIRSRARKELARESAQSPVPRGSSPDNHVTVEHNYLEGSTHRATLFLVPAETGEDYGNVTVPLVLETQQPRPLTVALSWHFKGTARAGWSRDWPGPVPGEGDIVSVPLLGWRKQPDSKRWHFCIQARLPIRKPREVNPRLELEVGVVDVDTKLPLGPAHTLKWEAIGTKTVDVGVVWSDATMPSHVRDHPIGPQERADALPARFAAGSNVAVIAPRRFGKSTLVEYLVKEGARSKLLVLPAMVCTRYRGAAGFDYESFWNAVSDRLVDALGVRLKCDLAGSLPPAEAFDAARAAAKERGHSAVVVLVDEAQLFFTGDLGSQCKTLLERHLSRTDEPGKVPAVFGFIGLPSLRDRAGADFMGLLNPIEKSRMDEGELRPLIAKMTTGLQTTRGARQRLADTAGNLLILKSMLESLATRASRERRLWVNFDDVIAVEEAIKKELKEGRELTVASYVRDVLNSADSVDDWRPITSLPVAAAWAHTWMPGRPDNELHKQALDLLNEWCRLSYGGDDHGVRPVYTPALLQRHLQQLRERQVLRDAEFASSLLHAWLVGVAGRRSFDEPFREALFSGAQRRIKLPSGAAQVDQGAEATIWRFNDSAFRVRQLAGPEQREQFLESIQMLEALRQVVQRGGAGSDHVFDLINVGLSESSEREAIQVYRWVEGQSLTRKEGALASDLVIDIGAKLARALKLLHRNGLLHRDISPRNIILDDVSDPNTLRPVLVDFGFARMVTTTMRTAMAGPGVAPEVRGLVPDWGRPADVYALAWSLSSLLDASEKEEGAALRQVLAKAMLANPEDRPNADELLESLEALETARKLEERRGAAWSEMWKTVQEVRHLPWFSAQMNKTREHLLAAWLGHYRSAMLRYGAIADFLNQLTESYPALRKSIWSIGLRDGNRPLKVAAAIRNQHVHGRNSPNQVEEQRLLLQEFESLDGTSQKQLLLDAISRVAVLCQLKPLPLLGERLLG